MLLSYCLSSPSIVDRNLWGYHRRPPTSMAQRDLNRLASGLQIQVRMVHIYLGFRASTSQRTSNQVPSTNRVGKSVGPAIWVLKALKMDVRTRLGKSRPAPAWWSVETYTRRLMFAGLTLPDIKGGRGINFPGSTLGLLSQQPVKLIYRSQQPYQPWFPCIDLPEGRMITN